MELFNMSSRRSQGFTLVELMVTVAVVGIVAAVAVPAYSGYLQRSKVPTGLDSLAATATRLEQFYQDNGNYGTADKCGGATFVLPTPTGYDQVSCTVTANGQAFEMSVSGNGALAGYKYSINQKGERKTVTHPKGVPSSNCWSVKGQTCDAS